MFAQVKALQPIRRRSCSCQISKRTSKEPTGKTVFILDEPTTGLHQADIKKLLAILERIVDNGDTVIIIEHNLDVIKVADYIIDLGPEGGSGGGTVVAVGTPEEVSNNPNSYTGEFLKQILNKQFSNYTRLFFKFTLRCSLLQKA